MKILYISQNFYPEMGAAAARVYELSRYWTEMGHNVCVLTSFPNYPDGIVYPDYKRKMKKIIMHEQLCGVEVLRTISFPTNLRSSLRRSLNYISFFISSVISSNFLNGFDVIIGTSPSLLVGLAGLIIARLKRSPFVFEVRDLWPEVITAIGAGTERSLSYKIFDYIASILYKKSDLIIVVTESFKDEIILSRGIKTDKIKVIENAVDTDFFVPFTVDPGIINEMELKDKFVISYIGTIGYTHGVEVILRAAPEMKQRIPELLFLIVGNGSDKERLFKMKNQLELDNVMFLDQQPKCLIPTFINASDISLVLSVNKPFFRKTIFAKVFEPMACGKPIIVGAEGETRNLVVEKANAGIDFEPESTLGLINSIQKLYCNPELRNRLGENGRSYVISEFSRSLKAKQYSDTLEKLTGKK